MRPDNIVWVNFRRGAHDRFTTDMTWKERVHRRAEQFSRTTSGGAEVVSIRKKKFECKADLAMEPARGSQTKVKVWEFRTEMALPTGVEPVFSD